MESQRTVVSLALASLVRFASADAGEPPRTEPAPSISTVATPGDPPVAGLPRTRNVILVMTDGLRWQEVFRGADESLLTPENGVDDKNSERVRSAYWRQTPEQRRAALMPFLWSTLVERGQIFGNRDRASVARITNTVGVSYPGYSETFCGFADPGIDGNKRIENPNVTVFEWISSKPEFRGQVAAFGAWELFPFIFNERRAGFPVDGGDGPIDFGTLTPTIELVNRLRTETPYRWGTTSFDSFVFVPAMDWIRTNKPRLVFLGMGETDEWAHEGNYASYLDAAHRVDSWLKELTENLEAMPEYRGTTSIVFSPDHGRGTVLDGKRDWPNHGPKHPGSDEIWMAFMGPDTPPLGERHDCPEVTQSQIAATIAALVGRDYCSDVPNAGKPIDDVLRPVAPTAK